MRFTKLLQVLNETIAESRIEVKYWTGGEGQYDYDEETDDPAQDPYVVADQVEEIFRRCEIRPDRNKEIKLVAIADGIIAGGVMASYSMEHEPENPEGFQDFIEYSFDVAVDPEFQRGTVGYLLIKAALQDAKSQSDGLPVKVRNWVVNPVAERMLHKLFGFSDPDQERHHNGGSCHMEKWL